MDKTPEYIEMCGKAVEIQAIAIFEELDLFWIKKVRVIDQPYYDNGLHWIGEPIWFCQDDVEIIDKRDFIPELNVNEEDIHALLEWTWLPRQDQLQAMIGSFNIYTDTKLFANWVRDCAYRQPVIWTSMEQLWLAYVMEQNFNKKWNGEDWINES